MDQKLVDIFRKKETTWNCGWHRRDPAVMITLGRCKIFMNRLER